MVLKKWGGLIMKEELAEKILWDAFGSVIKNPQYLVPVVAVMLTAAVVHLCFKVEKINFNAEFSNQL